MAIDISRGASPGFGSGSAEGFGPGLACMTSRLVALDEGPDIPLDRTMVVVGRHPQCDARLDSIRVSRRHCCMAEDQGEVLVRDLGSTNGIRINGQRVESGRLRPGDEFSIAHYRYRLEGGDSHQLTLADPSAGKLDDGHHRPYKIRSVGPSDSAIPVVSERREPEPVVDEKRLAAAVRDLLPSGQADRYRIQVVVRLASSSDDEVPDPVAAESPDPCRPDSSP